MNTLQNIIKEGERLMDENFTKGIDFSDYDLSPKERKVMEMRQKKHTLEEVGKEFGVTRERVRQIEAKVQEKTRQKERIKTYVASRTTAAYRAGVEEILKSMNSELPEWGFKDSYRVREFINQWNPASQELKVLSSGISSDKKESVFVKDVELLIAKIKVLLLSQKEEARKEMMRNLPEERIVHSYMKKHNGKSTEYCNGWNDYRNEAIEKFSKEKDPPKGV